MKSISVREGDGMWSVFVDGTWRGIIWIEIVDGVPVVLDVQADERLPSQYRRRHTKRRRRPGLGWSVVGELVEM